MKADKTIVKCRKQRNIRYKNGSRFLKNKQEVDSRSDPPQNQTTITIVWGGAQSNNNKFDGYNNSNIQQNSLTFLKQKNTSIQKNKEADWHCIAVSCGIMESGWVH